MAPNQQPANSNELKLPQYKADFRSLADVLKYKGFCAQMDSLNTKVIDRPLMEERWACLCTEKALPADRKTPKFAAAIGQIRGHAGFDVEKYWTDKARNALQKGVHLNTKAGNVAEGKSAEVLAEDYTKLIGAYPK